VRRDGANALRFFQNGGHPLGNGFDVLFERGVRDEHEELLEAAAGEVAQGLLAAPQHHVHLHLVSLAEEFKREFCLAFEIVPAGLEADAHHFNLGYAFLRVVLALLLGFGVLEFAEVHDFHHRRVGVGRNLNGVQTSFLGNAESLLEFHFPEVGARLVNGAHPSRAYLVVDAESSQVRVFSMV